MIMTPALDPSNLASLHPEIGRSEIEKQTKYESAQELNCVLSSMHGRVERLINKLGDHPVLNQELQIIFENLKHAESLVRNATLIRIRNQVPAAMQASTMA